MNAYEEKVRAYNRAAGAAVDEGWDALADSGGAIGEAGGAVVDTVGGWFD